MKLSYLLSNSKGVTLVELLGVIAIITVLSSVVIVSISGANEAAKQARAEHNVAILNEGIERFMSRGGDLTSILDSGSPEVALVNTLRSSDANIVRMGGPFIDSAMGPEMASTGWRAILKHRIIDGAMQVYFDVTDESSDSGIIGFKHASMPADFIPIGVPASLGKNMAPTDAAPSLPDWGAPVANTTPAPNATPSMSAYY